MGFEAAVHYLGASLIVIGCAFLLVGGIGMLRFGDFFSRLHPAGIKDALGMPLVIIGMMLLSGWNLISLKLFALLVFMVMTNPTASHATAQSAFRMMGMDEKKTGRKAPAKATSVKAKKK